VVGLELVLGVDGGGSETRCVALALDGREVGRGVGGPSNPLTVGLEASRESILEAASQALVEGGDVRASVLGLAGAYRSQAGTRLKASLPGWMGRVEVVSDARAAWAGATALNPGVVVIAGTGSIAYGVDGRGVEAYSGGWGWLLGDEGSGFWVGREAVARALKALGGQGEETALVGALEAYLGVGGSEGLLDWAYSGRGPREFASLVPLVRRVARRGDSVAQTILAEAGGWLASLAVDVVRRLGLEGGCAIYPCGGVLEEGGLPAESFSQQLKTRLPRCSVLPPRFEPAVGSALLALELAGVEVGGEVLARVGEGA